MDPTDSEVPVPLPPFTVPAETAAGAAALDAAVHAWDIAVATGQPSPLTAELAAALRPTADTLVEPLRGFAFGPPVEPAAEPTPPPRCSTSSGAGRTGRRDVASYISPKAAPLLNFLGGGRTGRRDGSELHLAEGG